MSSRSNGRCVHYHKLPETRRRKSTPARVWVLVRRAVAKAVGLYVGRQRWVVRHVRRVAWVALWAKVRKTTVSTTAPRYYDSASYARNFDDGRWKEEEEYWRSGSFAYRFGKSGKFGTLMENST